MFVELYLDIPLISVYRNGGATVLLSNTNNPPARFICFGVHHTQNFLPPSFSTSHSTKAHTICHCNDVRITGFVYFSLQIQLTLQVQSALQVRVSFLSVGSNILYQSNIVGFIEISPS